MNIEHLIHDLNFILPEFTALKGLDLSWRLYLDSPIIDYIITATKKLQALIRHDKDNFQDAHLLHRVAQRENAFLSMLCVRTLILR